MVCMSEVIPEEEEEEEDDSISDSNTHSNSSSNLPSDNTYSDLCSMKGSNISSNMVHRHCRPVARNIPSYLCKPAVKDISMTLRLEDNSSLSSSPPVDKSPPRPRSSSMPVLYEEKEEEEEE